LHNYSNYDNHQSLKENSVTYRGVEISLAVHAQVETSLRSLDRHYPQTHRNQVELCCGTKSRRIHAQRNRSNTWWRI